MAEQDKSTAAAAPLRKSSATKAATASRPSASTESATTTVTSTTSASASGASADAQTQSQAQEPATKTIERGKRLHVTLNVATVAGAFHNATASRSVRYVQYALHERGFEPGNDQGKVDFDTRKAYAEYQRTVDESPTGVPTAYSLDILGFDVS